MTRKEVRSDFRLVVRPDLWAHEKGNEALERKACEQIRESIRRHVDGADTADIEFSTIFLCEFCGDDSGPDEFECCDKSIEEHEKSKEDER